jgi:carbonic anhydrase/acetyltransferase-like protein (isoleucine patch superfamily)
VIHTLGDRAPAFEGHGHFVADNATLIGTVRLRDQASVWYNCVLRGDNDWIDIGERSNIQDGSVLHTDPGLELVVGNDVTVGHKVMLHGCSIGDESLIGIGATVLNGARIGRHTIIGAHALVTENKAFPDGVMLLGAPARVTRELTDDEIGLIRLSAEHYAKNAARYLESLRPFEH